ncbi:unnamed protein product [Mytilus coruscus]|uniref:Uncharacterized protein n=1 Tax=Mytilus coruscus TaxID=42192 RepID=A0A6J7ZWG6_MYTCO|nr:unnamed protein product [Mytilus coruscus]
MDHIDVATKCVRRLSLSFHISFICRFLQSLKQNEALAVIDMLEEGKIEETSSLWSSKFQDFMNTVITQNCIFALHAGMMQHCDEVVAVYLSERLGGNTGYNFLGALLIQHYSAGHFHQCLKKALYSTPIGNSLVNFACDSNREMDHQDALRGFRSGSSMTSVIGRMSLIDSFNETHQIRSKSHTNSKEDSNVDWALSETDLHHIIPTVALIPRRNGLCLEGNNYPQNVYTSEKLILSPCVLDNTTSDIGKYLIKRYLANNSFLGMTMDDIPELNETSGPASFVRRVKRSKGVTIKRTAEKVTLQTKTERQVKEENRKALLKREMQRASFLSSEMNMCQALVKPDCTKPKVMKSKGMQQALVNLLQELTCQQNIFLLNLKSVPKHITDTVELVTIEFAGVKFKTKVTSGTQYIKYVQNAVIKPILRQFPAAEKNYTL